MSGIDRVELVKDVDTITWAVWPEPLKPDGQGQTVMISCSLPASSLSTSAMWRSVNF
jgi:hypothetical protein